MKATTYFKNKMSGNNFLLFVTISMFLLMYIGGILVYSSQGFGTMQTFLNMLIDNAGLIIAASGMTVVLITGGIDISIGSVVGLVCMMLAHSMENLGMSASLSIALVLLFGIAFGTLQGWLVAYLKLQPFIVTLAGMFFAEVLPL